MTLPTTPDAASRHIVITGASSGIGASLARLYASEGASLSLAGRNAERLLLIRGDCEGLRAGRPGFVAAEPADVTETAAMQRFVEDAMTRAPIDIIFANAGMGGSAVLAGPHGEDIATAQAIVATNVNGVFNTVIPALPGMIERGRGHVVLIGSLASLIGLPQSPVYSASKAAVQLYGEGLDRHLSGTGVAVTVVLPGFVDTPMSQSLPFAPPGVWTAERAARHIAAGLDRRRREIAFPGWMALMLKLSALLPRAVTDRLATLAEPKRRDGDRRPAP